MVYVTGSKEGSSVPDGVCIEAPPRADPGAGRETPKAYNGAVYRQQRVCEHSHLSCSHVVTVTSSRDDA